MSMIVQEIDPIPSYLLKLPHVGCSLSLGAEHVEKFGSLTSPGVISHLLCVKVKCGAQ